MLTRLSGFSVVAMIQFYIQIMKKIIFCNGLIIVKNGYKSLTFLKFDLLSQLIGLN